MAQGSSLISKVAIIGAGPAGCMCAYFLQNDFDVTVFDCGSPLRSLLPTGGGRCNLAYGEYDFKELAKNYPRGEKFLYSVFSKFSTADTLEFFKNIGVETYTQDDLRIFPTSNSSKDVREKFLKALSRTKFKKEVVTELDFKNFDCIVVATGGHASYSFLKPHKIITPRPSLVGFKTGQKFPVGVSVQNVKSGGFSGDIIFTHEGISGPLIYKISSVNARREFPYKISLNFVDDINLQELLNRNSKKSIKNLLSEFVPKSFAEYLLNMLHINPDGRCCEITGKMRDAIMDLLQNFEIKVEGVSKGGEVVTSGGVDLREVNSKTMESKLVPNLYFCGEVLDIDGFCGGFNLQNCWSTAFVAAMGIKEKLDKLSVVAYN